MKPKPDIEFVVVIIIIILLGAFLRFYKLDWGSGLFFNPDELFIGISVSQLSFPSQLNPHLFSYGALPVYLVYFAQQLFHFIGPLSNPILIGRFFAALFSTLSILLTYQIARFFFPQRVWADLAAFLAAVTAGSIQQAHFTTPEAFETFFLLLTLLFLLHFTTKKSRRDLLLAAAAFGLALGTKVSAAMLAPTFLLSILFVYQRSWRESLQEGFLAVLIGTLVFLAAAPFNLLDFSSFKTSIEYETSIANGSLPVFYTRQFIDTTPVLFQLQSILPYSLGPGLLLAGLAGLLAMLAATVRKFSPVQWLLLLAFSCLFFPNAFLFVKWTRYMVPVLPILAVFAAYFLFTLSQASSFFSPVLTIILLVVTGAWAMAFFSIYLRPDIRVTASAWLNQNIPKGSTIAMETGNVYSLPLSGNYNLRVLDFYNLDTDPFDRQGVAQGLAQADYFIVASRRVFYNHQRLPQQFPQTARFYDKLFSGHAGFRLIGKATSFPQLDFQGAKLIFPDEDAEETWTVFDHPVVRVFQRQRPMSEEQYVRLFTQ